MRLDDISPKHDLGSAELEDYDLSGESGGEQQVSGSDDRFFVSKKAAAVFKHKLLKVYFPKFAGKAGSTEADKRLVYVDTHAGRGIYDDGTAGSPLLVAENVVHMAQRRIDCMFVEARKSNHDSLQSVLRQHMPEDAVWRTCHGRASDHLEDALTFAADSPLFMFIDPYGLGLSFSEVVLVLNRQRNGYGSKTEVLLNFIAMAFARAGGYLHLENPTTQQINTLRRLDDVLGGSWWRDIYVAEEIPGRAVERITIAYADRVSKATGCTPTLIPVKDRAHKQPMYWLLHFTRHPDGVWWIREAAAQAGMEWRRHCNPPPATDDGGLFQLEDRFQAEEAARQARWVDTIEAHARSLLAERGVIDVARDGPRLFGVETFGQAWAKHLRQALARLFVEGILLPKPRAERLEKYTGQSVNVAGRRAEIQRAE